MSRYRIELNHAGMREMLRSEAVRSALKEKAEQIADRAGDGFVAGSTIGRNRALAHVKADTVEAYRQNAEENTLLKAVK